MLNLPAILPGHWDTKDGRDMAALYADEPRFGGDTDLALAHAIGLVDRSNPHLGLLLMQAKGRIRWLSVQLAIAKGLLETAHGCLGGEPDDETEGLSQWFKDVEAFQERLKP